MNEPITILIVDDHQMVRQGVRAFLETQTDLAVVGEAASGEDAIRLADEHVPDVILMDLFPAIRAGALSYVLKDIGSEELADVVRKAALGEAVLHPRVAARLIREVQGTRDAEPNPFTELTDREIEVLQAIAEGLSNAKIAEKLVISEKTVKGHVSNVLGKLHLADRTQAAVYAWREGIVRRDP
jgi:NarL family two-component system response regulator LiaR